MSLWAPFRTAALGGLSVGMLAALLTEERVRGVTDDRRRAYARTWAHRSLQVLGVELEVHDEPASPPGTKPRLVVANHRSTVDILIMLHLFGGQLLARKDMASWPFIGVLSRSVGTLFVDREDPASGAAAVQSMRETLRRGITLCVFPEGTTHAGDEVRTFHAGAFLAIVRERGEIVPAGIAYERPEAIFGDEPALDHMKRIAGMPKIRAAVSIGAPRPAEGSTTRTLAEQAREDVQQLVYEARRRLTMRAPR